MNAAFSEYVLAHFRQLYRLPEPLPLAYGFSEKATGVQVKQAQTAFFEQEKPQPQPPVWKEWKGMQIPFFFSENADEAIISRSGGSFRINYDIIASAFYLLSGWQEYHTTARDQFGRFPYRESVQAKYGFVELPVVNYYFDILKAALEMALQQKLEFKRWPEPFITLITHDIDRCESGWKVMGKDALKRGAIGTFLKLFSQKWLKNDAWFNVKEMLELVQQHGAKSTCFFLCDQQKYQGHPNADYDITSPKYRNVLQQVAAAGAETAIHGSFETALNEAKLQQDLARLAVPVAGNRFHYLCYEPRQTPQVLEQAGLKYDSTLGFAEHIGFRHSYCHPFYPFDFRNKKPHRFLELPLHLMDTTLHHPLYMNLQPADVLPAVAPVIEEVRKFRGCFTVLWHNEHFENEQLQGRQVFEHLMQHLNGLQSGYRTASEVLLSYR